MAEIDMSRVCKGIKQLALQAIDYHNDGFVAREVRKDLETNKKYIEKVLAELDKPNEPIKGPVGPGGSSSNG